MIEKLLVKLKTHQKSVIIATLIITVLIGLFLILRKAGIFGSEIGQIDNMATIYFDQGGITQSGQSNTVSTIISQTETNPPQIISLTLNPATVKAKSKITFNTTWAAPAGSKVSLHACRSNAISGITCSGGSFCDINTATPSSPISCQYKTNNGEIRKSPLKVYVFVCNTENACSTSSPSQFTVTK